MDIDEILLEAEEKMDKAIEATKEDFASIRTGRANAAMFNRLTVDYYGAPTPLQQLASFQKSAISEIEKTLRDSDLGVNPSNDGNQIRCILPALTEERRKDYIKMAKDKAENGRVSVRNVRRKANQDIDKLVKDKEIGEDEGARAEKDLDALTKKRVDTIDALLKGKESELLEV